MQCALLPLLLLLPHVLPLQIHWLLHMPASATQSASAQLHTVLHAWGFLALLLLLNVPLPLLPLLLAATGQTTALVFPQSHSLLLLHLTGCYLSHCGRLVRVLQCVYVLTGSRIRRLMPLLLLLLPYAAARRCLAEPWT
jgi:hypothetical protein